MDKSELLNKTFSCTESQYDNMTAIDNSTHVVKFETTPWVIAGVVYYSLASLIAIVGNGMLMVTIFKRRVLHRIPYFLVANLAVKDFSFALVSCAMTMPGRLINSWYLSQESCIFFGFFSTWMSYVENLLLVTISVDRCVACVYPLRYHQILTSKRLCAILTFCWTYALVWSTMPLVGFGGYVYVETLIMCQLSWSPDAVDSSYIHAVGGLLFLPGTVAIVSCYVRIYATARKVRHLPTTVDQGERRSSGLRKATLTITLVTGVYFLCWIPFVGIRISRVFIHDFNSHTALTTFENVTVYTFMIANFANPIIYGIYNRDFRHELTSMFHRE